MLIILRDAVRFRRFLKYDWSENWRVSFFSHFKNCALCDICVLSVTGYFWLHHMFRPSLEELVSTTIYLLSVQWAAKETAIPQPSSSSSSASSLFLCHYLSELKLEAVTMTSSVFWTKTGIFRQPGDFNNLCNNFSVSADTHTWIHTK